MDNQAREDFRSYVAARSPALPSGSSEPSLGLWQLDDGDRSSYEILVYADEDGLLYHSEPVRLG